MKIGLYFGSFNPVHIGHLIVANTMIEEVGFDEVWLIISPQNPFKESSGLADEKDRMKMTELAVADHDKISAIDVEFNLPKPSYTIDTLAVLFKEHPDCEFSIIMGKDNLVFFHKWKNYKDILEQVTIHVYDRGIEDAIRDEFLDHPKIIIHHFPLVNVSSTRLRKKVAKGESIRYWVLKEVEEYILLHGIFQAIGDG